MTTTFADVLRELRAQRSLTQEELAERAGITVKAVSALERGERRRPYPHTVRSIADALGLDAADRERLVAAVPGRTPSGRPTTTLPSLHGPLLGRDADVETVVDLVVSRVRPVVTLTGPGGVGKTTLAVTVAGRVAGHFTGGVSLVDLAALTDPDAVLPAIAGALGIPEGGYRGTATGMAPYLEHRRLLLVLDNLEQVVDCAAQLGELVGSCPDLTVLATSRAPLRIRAEREFRVAPLTEPDAVRLFLERATAAGAQLRSTDQASVEALCREAEGLPLAIELSASAAGALGPQALLERLGTLATEGPRDLPQRQRSIEATLDWSVGLLPGSAKELLGCLGVLPASFTPAAADAVGGERALSGLHTLLEHSLLTRVGDVAGVPRYRLLEPVRQYAVSHWPDQPAARQGLGSYVRDTARHRDRDLRGAHLVTGLDLLDADMPTLGAGLTCLVEQERNDEAADTLRHLWLHLAVRGHLREGYAWLELLRDRPMADASRAGWLIALGGLHYVAGDTPALRAATDSALSLARLAGREDLALEAAVLAAGGAVFAGDLAGASALLEETAGAVDASPERWVRAHFGIVRGQLALVSGDLDGAEATLRRTEVAARDLGNPFTLATTLNVLATISELKAEHAVSAVLLAEATELSADAGMSWTLAYCLPALAGVAVRVGESALGARLFGASASFTDQHGVATSFQPTRQLAARDLADARDDLGDAAFRAEWDAGRSATVEDVADLARTITARAHA